MKKHLTKIAYLVVSVALVVSALIFMPGHDLIKLNEDTAADIKPEEVDHRIEVGNGPAAFAYKNETVYVVLNADGTVADLKVVNWIYDMDNRSLDTIVDYGCYTSVNNMKSEKIPMMNDDHVVWDQESLVEDDIFYEGTTLQELPVDIDITYRLDGQELSAAEVAGRSGHLKIIINVENKLKENGLIHYDSYEGGRVAREDENCVPMVVQGTCTVDSKKFSDIRATNGSQVVVGETINIGFMTFPLPDAEIEIDMQAVDIEITPITLTIMPQMPPIPDIDLEDDFIQMLDGVTQIGSGLMQLYDALNMMIGEFENFQVMALEIAEGMKAFFEDNEELVKAIEDLLDNTSRDDLEELLDRIKDLDLPDITDEWEDVIDNLPDEWPDLPDEWPDLPDESPDIPDEWPDLPDRSPDIPDEWPDLLDGIEGLPAEAAGTEGSVTGMVVEEWEGPEIADSPDNKNGIDAAANSDEQNSDGLPEEIIGAGDAVDDPVNSEVEDGDFPPGNDDEEKLDGDLPPTSGDEEKPDGDLPPTGGDEGKPAEDSSPTNGERGSDREEQIEDALESIRDHLEQVDFDQARRNLDRFGDEMENHFADLPEALDQLVNAPRLLADGIKEIHDRGIVEIEKGLIEGIDEMRFGQAKVDRMEELANGYRSFMDERNINSNVQFLLQTKKVEKEEKDDEKDGGAAPPTERRQVGLWERIVNLFAFLSAHLRSCDPVDVPVTDNKRC